jgi:2-polyprenyl-3-methyl-5-hydroxy-6-metoxy-1,4-benzoquinol methylase
MSAAIDRLARAAAAAARGPAFVIAGECAPFIRAFEARGQACDGAMPGDDAASVRRLRTLPSQSLRAIVLAILNAGDGAVPPAAVLRAAWSRLRPGGRLFIIVPNADALPRERRAPYHRRVLRSALASFGRPERLVDQPYAWQLWSVRVPRQAGAPAPRRLERFAVIAAHCRGSVLELGCGRGELSACIAAHGHAVTGVDLNHMKVAYAHAHQPGIDFVRADICELRLGRRFETVVLAEVLEHVPPEVGAAMLETAALHLTDGGRLIVSVPNENCIPHRNHVRTFDRRGLKALLARFGAPRFHDEQPFKWLLAHVDVER